MSTHGPQHDEFGTRRNDAHGGATFDEGFNSFAAAHSNAHGKLFDKFSERPGVDRYGEHWDEFPWKDVPSLHGQHYDEGYDSPTFDGGEHGQLHDVFRGARVRYMYGGRDVEGIVLDTQKEFAVVESREGDRHEVMLSQVLQYATAQGNPHAGKKPVEALDNDSGDITPIENGSQKPGPQGERPSGESTANGGARVEGGSYDDTVVTHVKSFDDALEVVKSLAPFDEAEFDRDAYAFADVAKSSDGSPGVAHLSTAKLNEAHAKFSDHYTAARVTGNHERAHFAAHVLASIHQELATRGVMAEKPDEGSQPITRGLSKGHQPLRNKSVTDDADVSKKKDLDAWYDTGKRIPRTCRNCHAGLSPQKDLHPVYDETTKRTSMGYSHSATCANCGAHHYTMPSVGKSMDAGETATQQQDVESGPAANWCKNCQHYCRKVEAGKCPTCGNPVGVKKSWMDELDVLKDKSYGELNQEREHLERNNAPLADRVANRVARNKAAAAERVSDSIAQYHGYNRVQPCKNCGTERSHNNVRQEGGKAFGTCTACHSRNPMTRKA